MDDALTLVHLFAALPSEASIKTKVTNKAKALAAAWGAYCATTSSITKSFISVKGVYLESEIRGSTLRWVIPHSFTQNLPEDVDYRVMLTFFEFYDTLLSFVLFKLYSDIGVRYPFPLSLTGEEMKGSTNAILASNLSALKSAFESSSSAVSNVITATIEKASEEDVQADKPSATRVSKAKSKALIKSIGAALNNLEDDDSQDEDNEDDDGDADISGPLKAALESMTQDEESADRANGPALDEDAIKRKRLFAGLTFFLSREVPRGYLELLCLSYGGRVGWDGHKSPITATDPFITHHIVDRPKLPSSYDSLPKSREFVQPQWVLDCANFLFLLPIAKYGVGAALPPHLSPWVDDEEEGYTPAYAQEVERLINGEVLEEEDSEAVEELGADEDKEEGISRDESAGESEQDEEENDGGDEEEEESDEAMKEREALQKTEEVSCLIRRKDWLASIRVTNSKSLTILAFTGERYPRPSKGDDEQESKASLRKNAAWHFTETGQSGHAAQAPTGD